MTAMPAAEGRPGDADDLVPEDASPSEIAGFLLPDDRERFRLAYECALKDARTTLDPAGVLAVVDDRRGLAVLQADPEDFARLVRTASERLTCQPVPQDEPLAVTRARLGL